MEKIALGIEYLRSRDPVLAAVIEEVGGCSLNLDRNIFKSLVRAIIAQQISTSAARSIYRRLIDLAGGEARLVEQLAGFTLEEYRSVGVSAQKARYLSDLAQKVASGEVRIDAIHDLSNEAIIEELTKVKGIGKWTVQMLLIFSLGRLDVFPGDDLGIRTAIKNLYRKRGVPKAKQLRKFEKLWQPYASIASWYCWRSLELERSRKKLNDR